MNTHFLSWLTAGLFVSSIGFGQGNKPPHDYLQVPGPISFANQAYQLVWSSHPSTGFYKQEYLVTGDQPERFKTMLMLDVITGPATLSEVVRTKVNELQRRKPYDPVAGYEVVEKGGEYMLDFLLSQSTPDGKRLTIVEHNVYRYKMIADQSGRRAVLLFGVSMRGYDGEVNLFLAKLKANRAGLLRQVSAVNMPQIAITSR